MCLWEGVIPEHEEGGRPYCNHVVEMARDPVGCPVDVSSPLLFRQLLCILPQQRQEPVAAGRRPQAKVDSYEDRRCSSSARAKQWPESDPMHRASARGTKVRIRGKTQAESL